MTAFDDLVALLARYDDDAWAGVANRGLLRRGRKDLEAVEVSLVLAEPAVVQVGEHRVTFDATGPAGAVCSCPAATICQHVLTAGLWLGAQAELSDSVPGSDSVPLHDELMSFDRAALVSYAGTPGVRWAAQFAADLDDDAVRISQEGQVRISFSAPRVTFRFMGGGLAGIVPDEKLPTPEKYVAAAVLAYQKAHGAEPVSVEPAKRRETATVKAQIEGRGRFLDAATNLLLDTVRLGAAHLSPAVHQRYETIAVWAQGAEFHRLALILRRLADHVELLLDRNARADEHRLLDDAALAYALVCALKAAGEPAPTRLAGRARTTYTPVRSMELVGLGGLPWQAASGYQGLTCLFWWTEERRFVSWTDARPESVWSFDPRNRWTQPGPWSGLGSPSLTAGRSVRLSDAQLSTGGRLSGVERTQAAVGPLVEAPWAEMPVIDTWANLEERARVQESLLDEPDPLRAWVLLRPSSWDKAVFDPVRQIVWWLLRDSAGTPLALNVRWTSLSSHCVQRLESLTAKEMPEGALVVARLASVGGGVSAEPLSIVRGNVVDSLHFDAAASAAKARALSEQPAPEERPAALPGPLRDLRSYLLQQMERGTGAAASGTLLARLEQHQRAARDVGFSAFAPPATDVDPAEALLRTHYVGLQVAELLS